MIEFQIYRSDPHSEEERYDSFSVELPDGEKWTTMQILDEIYTTQDPTLAYFKHSACNHGKCNRCTMRLNGKVILACQTYISEHGTYKLEPVSKKRLVRDLVMK